MDRPVSRVAEGHREATRSALDAGWAARTMCAEGMASAGRDPQGFSSGDLGV